MPSAHGRLCYLKMWINTAANGPAEELQDPRHRKTHIKVQLDTLVSRDLWVLLVRQAWLQLDFAQLPRHCWDLLALHSTLIYKHCSASLGIHFKVITQPHRLNVKSAPQSKQVCFFFLMISFQDCEDFDAIQLWGTACQQSTSVTNKNNKMEPG